MISVDKIPSYGLVRKIKSFEPIKFTGRAGTSYMPGLQLHGVKESFPLNETNTDRLMRAQVGDVVCLYRDTVKFAGKDIPVIRVRLYLPVAD